MITFCQLGPPVILYIVSSALFTANQKWVWGFHQELCSRLFLWCFKPLGYFKVPAERGIAPSGPSLLSLLIGERLPWSGGKENVSLCCFFSEDDSMKALRKAACLTHFTYIMALYFAASLFSSVCCEQGEGTERSWVMLCGWAASSLAPGKWESRRGWCQAIHREQRALL